MHLQLIKGAGGMEIKRISKEQAWQIRQLVMWPDRDIEYVKLANDDEGIHYGLFHDQRLVSVVSLFTDQLEAQFRKFATLEQDQGKGHGSKLLSYIVEEARTLGFQKIWCNARRNKASFYAKFGFIETEQLFTKCGLDYVIMKKSLNQG
jgi:GNAT superfamily N-acetyltransferase